MSIFLFPIIAALAVVISVMTIRAIQRRIGGNFQQRALSYIMLWLAVVLDVLVITFSISVCSYATRQGLEIRGDAVQNSDILRLLSGSAVGEQGVTVASLWGFIIPLLSWVTAHGVVFGIVEFLRYFVALVGLGPLIRRTQQSAGSATNFVRTRLHSFVTRLCGSALLTIVSLYLFKIVISFDRLLFQYQIIDVSLLRKELGGRGWSLRYSPEQLTSALQGTFLGQMALHAGNFYVVCLFITAFLLIMALNRAWQDGHENPAPRPTDVIFLPGTPPQYPPGIQVQPRELERRTQDPPATPVDNTPEPPPAEDQGGTGVVFPTPR